MYTAITQTTMPVIHIPASFSYRKGSTQKSEFWIGNIVVIMIASLLLMAVSILDLLFSNGLWFYLVMAVISGITFSVSAFIIILSTYNSGNWFRLISASFCDMLVVIIACITLCISIYTSMSIRGFIFHVIAHFQSHKHIQYTDTWNFSVPYQSDISLLNGYAVLTQFAQHEIFMHQNPGSCSTRKLLLSECKNLGLGAEIHTHALMLGKAMDNGFIFAWSDAACSAWGGHCRDFFLPEHNCTPEDVAAMQTVTFSTFSQMAGTTVPSVFVNKLHDLRLQMTHSQLMYWWKAQGSAYLMRFNTNTVQNIASMRYNPKVNQHMHGEIPAGTVNVNIRMGDKFDEMHLPEPENYMTKLEQLYIDSPLSYSKWVYITSDSEYAVQQLARAANSKQWGVLFSNVPRMPLGYVNADARSFFNYNVTISVLMQLTMTTECSAWVGSRGSNWNRIIDERRCVASPKCAAPFIEVSDEIVGLYNSPSALM